MAPGTAPGFGSHQHFGLFAPQAQPRLPELREHKCLVPRFKSVGLVWTCPHGQWGASSACPVTGHQQHAEAGKAAGTPPGPCPEVSPILVGSKAWCRGIPPARPRARRGVTSPPGWGGVGQWHSMAAGAGGMETLCSRSPCSAPQPRDQGGQDRPFGPWASLEKLPW